MGTTIPAMRAKFGSNNYFIATMKAGELVDKLKIPKELPEWDDMTLEEKFQKISHKYNLPYKFVGNGSFILGNYNPDFININNKKIAIEVYDRYYKKRNYISIEEWRKKRAKIFKEFGWKIMFFDETEVNEDYVLSKLGGE